MGLLAKLFGGGEGKKPIGARDALAIAQNALRESGGVGATDAQLCCVYTSAEDAQRPLENGGLSRAWHVDFYVPREQKAILVRVRDGSAKSWSRPLNTDPVEYIYAAYGKPTANLACPAPAPLPDQWVDSPAVARAAFEVARRELAGSLQDQRQWEDYSLLCLVMSADYLRVLHHPADNPLVRVALPAAPCFGVIIAHADVDTMNSAAVYIDALTGEPRGCDVFRFPPLQMPGHSVDW